MFLSRELDIIVLSAFMKCTVDGDRNIVVIPMLFLAGGSPRWNLLHTRKTAVVTMMLVQENSIKRKTQTQMYGAKRQLCDKPEELGHSL